ncbi:MAG TPA: hypothetical protein VGI79_21820 [Caulobacteraceae bacterium]|jgi:hypothetical protein
MSRPTRAEVAEQDAYMLRRQRDFRLAADCVASELAKAAFVDRIALIGSVAGPLGREVPRFSAYRRHGIEIVHECKDVDLAVWVSRNDQLQMLRRARIKASQTLLAQAQVGVADHQIELFLIAPGPAQPYLGRVCCYKACPAAKRDCQTPGCGAQPFLKLMEGFTFWPQTLDPTRMVVLFDRAAGGVLARAADLPSMVRED